MKTVVVSACVLTFAAVFSTWLGPWYLTLSLALCAVQLWFAVDDHIDDQLDHEAMAAERSVDRDERATESTVR